MATSDPKRQLKIKTGVVKRLAKEKKSYEKEALQQEEKVATMKSDGRDEYEVRKAMEVLEESQMMVPDCQKRLAIAIGDLRTIIESNHELANTEEYKAAVEQLEAAEQ